jgi:hypothetical protein
LHGLEWLAILHQRHKKKSYGSTVAADTLKRICSDIACQELCHSDDRYSGLELNWKCLQSSRVARVYQSVYSSSIY